MMKLMAVFVSYLNYLSISIVVIAYQCLLYLLVKLMRDQQRFSDDELMRAEELKIDQLLNIKCLRSFKPTSP